MKKNKCFEIRQLTNTSNSFLYKRENILDDIFEKNQKTTINKKCGSIVKSNKIPKLNTNKIVDSAIKLLKTNKLKKIEIKPIAKDSNSKFISKGSLKLLPLSINHSVNNTKISLSLKKPTDIQNNKIEVINLKNEENNLIQEEKVIFDQKPLSKESEVDIDNLDIDEGSMRVNNINDLNQIIEINNNAKNHNVKRNKEIKIRRKKRRDLFLSFERIISESMIREENDSFYVYIDLKEDFYTFNKIINQNINNNKKSKSYEKIIYDKNKYYYNLIFKRKEGYKLDLSIKHFSSKKVIPNTKLISKDTQEKESNKHTISDKKINSRNISNNKEPIKLTKVKMTKDYLQPTKIYYNKVATNIKHPNLETYTSRSKSVNKVSTYDKSKVVSKQPKIQPRVEINLMKKMPHKQSNNIVNLNFNVNVNLNLGNKLTTKMSKQITFNKMKPIDKSLNEFRKSLISEFQNVLNSFEIITAQSKDLKKSQSCLKKTFSLFNK